MHFLDELNESQRKAAEHLYGATMVTVLVLVKRGF